MRHAWIALVTLGLAAYSAAAAPVKITVQTDRERVNTPMSVEIAQPPAEPVQLVEVKGGQRIPVPCQLDLGKPARLQFILTGATPANSTRIFELTSGQNAPTAEPVTVRKDDKVVEVRLGEIKALQYNHAVVPPPKGQKALFARGGFVHPLWTPAGGVLTNIHPADHIHHLGLWNVWTSTTFEGRHVDFWNIGDGTGTARFVGLAQTVSGPVYGEFTGKLDHVDLKAPGGEKVALNETLTMRVWSLGDATKNGYVLDWTSTQRCASNSPLVLEKYRYGGIGFRSTPLWKDSASTLLTSEGKNRTNAHGTRSRWCKIDGPVEGGRGGIVFMSDPRNRQHPEPMRIWDKGDQFFNYCPIQMEAWTLQPGNDYTLRYRMYIHDGAITAEQAESLWRDLAEPPKVTVE